MKYRTMRFIGGEENVSLLGLGCMRFPLKEDGTIDEVQTKAMIERAINAGINYINLKWKESGIADRAGYVIDRFRAGTRVLQRETRM